jgi:hypothetical protein
LSHNTELRSPHLPALVLVAAVLAGCSANTAVAPSSATAATSTVTRDQQLSRGFGRVASRQARVSGWMTPDKKKKPKPLMYWGSYDSNTIDIFSAKGTNPPLKGQITAGLSNPERLFVDKKLNVYATNIGNDTITAYKPGATSPFLTISNAVNSPTGLTVDSAGTVYCANVGNDTITEYPKGQTSPSVTIPAFAEYLAIDSKDNLYASEASAVYEFAPGSTSGTNLNLSVTSPGAIEVDKSGNVILLDEASNEIDVFPAGKTQPSQSVPVTAGLPFGFSLSKNEKALYVSVLVSGGFIVQQLDYPNGNSLTTKLSGLSYGEWPIAVSPDAAL